MFLVDFNELMMRRLSTRRDTMAALEKRRSSFMNMERRRSTIAMTRNSISSKVRL
jgi:transcriptional regulator